MRGGGLLLNVYMTSACNIIPVLLECCITLAVECNHPIWTQAPLSVGAVYFATSM